MDKEYVVLDIIGKNENITQREISRKMNLSLGSVNLLLNKMAHDGLIKIKQIPMNRVAYMLTPKGMAEKVNKTYSYIKTNYSYINETKEKMKNNLIILKNQYDRVAIYIDEDETSELLRIAANEVKGFVIFSDIDKLSTYGTIVTTSSNITNFVYDKSIVVINLLELI